jgi:hypothetical protein
MEAYRDLGISGEIVGLRHEPALRFVCEARVEDSVEIV